MGIFTKKQSTSAAAEPAAEKKTKKVAKKKVKETTPATDVSVAAAPEKKEAAAVHPFLTSPRVSEKAAVLAAVGTYVFNVPLNANKLEVRKAVEKQYKVSVVRVNMLRGEGKIVRRGRVSGQRSNWKKALVTLKKGQKIELHQGV